MIDLLAAPDAASDRQQTVFLTDSRRFNSYIQCAAGQEIWQPGDFLVHFAGIYDSKTIKHHVGIIEESIKNNTLIKPIKVHPAKEDEYAAIFLPDVN